MSTPSVPGDQRIVGTYRRLLGYSKRYWLLIAAGILGMIVDAACTAGFTLTLEPLMDEGFLADNWGSVRELPLLVVAIFVGRGLGTLVSTYAMAAAGRSVIFDLRQQLFEKLLDLPASFYDRHASGQLISRLTFNVEQVANAATDAITTIIRDSLYIAFFVGVMLLKSVQLTLAVLVLAPVLGIIAGYVGRRFRKLSRRIQESVGDVAHRSSEVIGGHQVVKSFGAQQFERDLFLKINRHNRRQHLKLVLTKSSSVAVVHIIAGLALAGIIYYATSTLVDEGMTAGAFIAFITAMLAILPSLRRLTNVMETVQKGVAAADSIFAIVDLNSEERDRGAALDNVKGRVAYKNVTLAYEGAERAAVSNVSFEMEPGSMTALVGRSGSGKSSLASMLSLFYTPSGGCIELDGVDIRSVRLGELRQKIAVVGQQVVLFHDTIAANIAYGRETEVDRESMIQAAREAGAWDFIQQLPDGLDTVYGADGVQLSGGQKQRIAIARAMLWDAPILVLDEPTSALDAETERAVYQALERLSEGRTTLVIAHRLSTIERADQVLVMDSGALVERGSHEQLLANGGLYAALHRMQFGD